MFKRFLSELHVHVDYGQEERILLDDLIYYSDIIGTVVVPKGFRTDFASTPRFTWIFFDPHDVYAPAAVIHDYLYKTGSCTRKEADAVFLEAMKDLKVDRFRRNVMWAGVRLFGGFGYEH